MTRTTRKFTIVVTGDSDEAYEEALRTAVNSIKGGNLSGTDRNEESAYYFDSTTDVPDGEKPSR